MGKIVKSLLGGGEKPTVQSSASSDTEDAARKAKKSRTALLETEGGIAGQELDAGAVAQRNTLLGN